MYTGEKGIEYGQVPQVVENVKQLKEDTMTYRKKNYTYSDDENYNYIEKVPKIIWRNY